MPQKTSIFLLPLGKQNLPLSYKTPPAPHHPGEKAELFNKTHIALWEWAHHALPGPSRPSHGAPGAQPPCAPLGPCLCRSHPRVPFPTKGAVLPPLLDQFKCHLFQEPALFFPLEPNSSSQKTALTPLWLSALPLLEHSRFRILSLPSCLSWRGDLTHVHVLPSTQPGA